MRRAGADVIVVGAGIAGLTVAHDAARAGLRTVVLEAADRVGGLLDVAELDGMRIDIGAESFATRTTGVADLIADAGLPLQVVSPAPGGAYLAASTPAGIVRAPLPRRTIVGIPADPFADDVVALVGAAGAARVAEERAMSPLRAHDEPSLADLVAARCGQALVDALVDPLCRSIYSQPADAVRLSRVHPTLWREAVARGSLLAGVAALASDERAGGAVAGIAGGMWRLAAELTVAAEALGVRVHTGVSVHGVAATAAGVLVHTDGATWHAAHVVVATGTAAARALLTPDLDAHEAPEAPSVRVVAALVDHHGFDAHPVGTGVILAPGVDSAAKALTHATAKWSWLADAAPEGRHVLRLSARDAAAPGLDTCADIAREITLITGITVTPADLIATTDARYSDAVAAAPVVPERRAELAANGIHLAGAGVAGTGLASVIPHARALAATLSLSSSSRSTPA